MMQNAPAGDSFDAFGDHHMRDTNGIYAKGRDIPAPLQDERVPGRDPSLPVPQPEMNDLEQRGILEDILRRERQSDWRQPALYEIPGDVVPPMPHRNGDIMARPSHDVMKPLVTPGEETDSVHRRLEDFRKGIRSDVTDATQIEA